VVQQARADDMLNLISRRASTSCEQNFTVPRSEMRTPIRFEDSRDRFATAAHHCAYKRMITYPIYAGISGPSC
jgi:hypothetical protein